MKGKPLREIYRPLSKAAVKRILEADRAAGYGPEGHLANRTRFYLFLTQRGSDVQVRTVAVKASKRNEAPMVKEVVLASVDDPEIHILDVVFVNMAGYVVDWSPEGMGPCKYWDYRGRWESESWDLAGMWKLQGQVVNPELLKRTRRFRYCAWDAGHGYILDFLKVYKAHPGIEFLAKQGLGYYCRKLSLIRKLEKDRAFLRFFGKQVETVRKEQSTVPEILNAFRKGISLQESRVQLEARKQFRGEGLPRCLDAEKALAYIEAKMIGISRYGEYIRNCVELGFEIRDTKVSFPKQFNRRNRIVSDRIEVLRAEQDAERNRKLNENLNALAEAWGWMESVQGAFRISIPRTVADFRKEGEALRNCMGENYAARAARGDVLVVFVRKSTRPRTAFVAVEYDLKKQRVSQCYGERNSRPADEVLEFVDGLFDGGSNRVQEVAA